MDILINNAGISSINPQYAKDTPVKDVQNVFDTNFMGVISVTQSFLGLLKKSDSPRISNITSGLGSLSLQSDPTRKYYPYKSVSYVTSKAALNVYTIVLAFELRELPLKVNAINPGYTATDFNHHRGLGTVESVAAFIIKHTVTNDFEPTSKFFSKDIEERSEVSLW